MAAAAAMDQTAFYVVGGTLQSDAASYVTRPADEELLEGLRQNQFCYVLTSRQMGKSSLMVRTTIRLRAEGVAVAVLDLTAIGQNLTPEKWYYGLLTRIGRHLHLEDELDEFWEEHDRLGPLQRWMLALRQVVLERYAGPVVLFVDEIDAVRSLPSSFSTDEFFAAIRECHNARTQDPELRRLTFCLLGVATPSDLIRDPHTTPFNIGRRIELTDFTLEESAPLAEGLSQQSAGSGKRLLQRILYWTGGQPYLTQRLCRALVQDAVEHGRAVIASQDVDRLCDQLFLSREARETDANLTFVRDRLLRGETDIATLLDLYAKVRAGHRVRDDETNPLISTLRLAGIVRDQNGLLTVRNRIYATVFDRLWIRDNMPNAEIRRQQAAFRRGQLRAALFASLIIGAMVAMLGIANHYKGQAQESEKAALGSRDAAQKQTIIAKREKKKAIIATRKAEEKSRELADAVRREKAAKQQADTNAHTARFEADAAKMARRRVEQRDADLRLSNYIYNIYQAGGKWDSSDAASVERLLNNCIPRKNEPDLRGFEWYYLSRLLHSELFSLPASVKCAAFSPDNSLMATGGQDGVIRLWNAKTGKHIALWNADASGSHPDSIYALAFSPDGQTLATGGNADITLWNVTTHHEIRRLQGHTDVIQALVFSPDGQLLASSSWDRSLRLWHTNNWQTGLSVPLAGLAYALAFAAPDVLRTAETGTQADSATVKLSELTLSAKNVTERTLSQIPAHLLPIHAVAFSRDGRLLATGSEDRTVKIWDVGRAQLTRTLRGHTHAITLLAFAPGVQMLASGSDSETCVWSLKTPQGARIAQALPSAPDAMALSGPRSQLAFSQGGRGNRTQVDLLSLQPPVRKTPLTNSEGTIRQMCYSPDGKWLLTVCGQENCLRLWNIGQQRAVQILSGQGTGVTALACSPQKHLVACAYSNNSVGLWQLEPAAGQQWSLDSPLVPHAIPLHWNLGLNTVSLAFTPDGRWLAAGDTAGDVTIYDTHSWQPIKRIANAHAGPVTTLAFSFDTRTLATGSEDHTVKLWNVASWQELTTLHEFSDILRSLAFLPDSRSLAAASQDGTVTLWGDAAR